MDTYDDDFELLIRDMDAAIDKGDSRFIQNTQSSIKNGKCSIWPIMHAHANDTMHHKFQSSNHMLDKSKHLQPTNINSKLSSASKNRKLCMPVKISTSPSNSSELDNIKNGSYSVTQAQPLDEVDIMLKQIDSIAMAKSFPSVKNPSRDSSYKSSPVSNNHRKALYKCYPVLLCSRRESNVCNSLHCTTCDCAVVSFDGYKWANDADYMFLRLNYPDKDQLLPKLIAAPTFAAYCCQCSHVSATNVATQLNILDSSIRWFCKGHSLISS